MIKASTMLVAGLTFSCGLVLGLLLHLPGVYSPATALRHKRSLTEFGPDSSVHIGHRTLLATVADDNKNSSEDVVNNRLPSAVSKVGLSRTIGHVQQPAAKPPSSAIVVNSDDQLSGKRALEKHDQLATLPLHIQTPRVKQRPVGKDKYDDTNTTVDRADPDSEIEVELINNTNDNPANNEKSNVKTYIDNFVYWSDEVEQNIVPDSFSHADAQKWRAVVESGKVVHIAEGCGRMQNRRLTFADGTMACARYRLNTDQMQGEVYSYYLARLLGIHNVPPAVLQLADTLDDKWRSVDDDVVAAQWHPGKVLAVTPWLDDLQPVYIPSTLRPVQHKQLHPDTKFSDLPEQDLTELVQWSDLIVFDYLTANLDRMVNNMFNLQWNSAMMDSPTHNLEKNGDNGPLVFLDNESGLFHSYRLLSRYSEYHEELLQALCVFRKQTAAAVTRLAQSRDIGAILQATLEEHEPLAQYLPRMPQSNVQILQRRVDTVHQQILRCQQKFSDVVVER